MPPHHSSAGRSLHRGGVATKGFISFSKEHLLDSSSIRWIGDYQHRLLLFLSDLEELRPRDLVPYFCSNPKSAYAVVRRLEKQGVLKRVGHGVYRVVRDAVRSLLRLPVRHIKGGVRRGSAVRSRDGTTPVGSASAGSTSTLTLPASTASAASTPSTVPGSDPRAGSGVTPAPASVRFRLSTGLLSKVSARYNLPKVIAERRGRLVYHVPYDEPVSVPIAVYLFGWYLKQPILLLTDPRGVDEVIDAAESVDGFVVVPADSYPEIVPLVSFKYSKVVLCGKTVLKVRATPIEVHTTPMEAETRQVGLAELVLTYYGLRLDPEEVDRYVKRASVENLIRVLSIVGTHGVSIRDAWSLGGVER